jgi:hypothetical protein
MSLYSRIEKQIEESVKTFCRSLVEKFDHLNEEELLAMWKTCSKSKKQTNRKKSAYQNFYKVTYAQLKSESPNMSFGDIAKEISKQWKSMSQVEKDKFKSSASPPPKSSPVLESPPPKSSPVLESPPPTPKKNKNKKNKETEVEDESPPPTPKKNKNKKSKENEVEDEYTNMKIPELKKLCKERGVSIKGMTKRNEFLEILRRLDEESKKKKSSPLYDDDNDETGSTFSALLEEEEESLLA